MYFIANISCTNSSCVININQNTSEISMNKTSQSEMSTEPAIPSIVSSTMSTTSTSTTATVATTTSLLTNMMTVMGLSTVNVTTSG